ncbi:hypothetical protein [Okeania sp. KiyG1]|uniref:hypothetical protein n=1 Tax=Okeania sp. KiyG1 TaxID=2720165 RepID=UPI00198F7E99|nr:hypothetical protein [Okeania sp. KiyG1]GGA15157.1 hypothetical protein CYANOKiyG1_28940 [Okeania sp. KiyG1]
MPTAFVASSVDSQRGVITWDKKTKWSNTVGLHEAREVPEDLQKNPEFAAAVAQSEAASQQQQ